MKKSKKKQTHNHPESLRKDGGRDIKRGEEKTLKRLKNRGTMRRIIVFVLERWGELMNGKCCHWEVRFFLKKAKKKEGS